MYFGDLGNDAATLLRYFECNGAPKCDPQENPAEYMLNVINEKKVDWPKTWLDSPECDGVYKELARIKDVMGSQPASDADDSSKHTEFAMPLTSQVY